MKKRIGTVLLTLVMLLCLLTPAYAQEIDLGAITDGYEGTDILTQDDLALLDARLTGVQSQNEEENDRPVTQQDVVVYLLRYAGMKDNQLSAAPADGTEDEAAQFKYDCNALAGSMGLLNGVNYQPEEPCSVADFTTMLRNTDALYDALHADKLEPLFINGMAQPIFEYTSGIPAEGETYSNADSEIIRYCVYVESNYDTDGDGKLDLVKALVQVPRAAVEGDYKAATIYEARPYITGCTSDYTPYVEGTYDLDSMYSQPATREASGTAITAEAAAAAKSEDWYYWNPQEESYAYEDLTWYDYYLVRGFAVVESGGIGTKGSDGFETCGSDLEIDAFKCVIEWLTGDRAAYTDKTGNIAIKADWSSGSVGMTGRSYAGTTQFGLAATGVKGLKTIVPVAGIASWYEYTNSQGVSTSWNPAYSDWLAWYCAGRYLDNTDYATIADKYGRYLYQIQQDQLALNGDYGEHWAVRDYTIDWANIQIPALIVHGLNDTNVRTKQFDLMHDAFTKAGQNVKLMLHQGTHLTPTYPSQEIEMYIDGEYYDNILNKWFSHYLYGVDNGIESMENVAVQDNVDGSWDYYDSWETAYVKKLNTDDVTEDAVSTVSKSSPATYTFDIDEDTVIQGPVAVHVRASTTAENLNELDAIRMTVTLADTNAEPFQAYVPEGSYLPLTTLRDKGAWMGGGVENFDLVEYEQTETQSKPVGSGYIDLFNPGSGYASSTAAERTQLENGVSYDYTVYIQPTFYTVKAGHQLTLSVSVNSNDVSLSVDNAATYMDIPVHDDPAPIYYPPYVPPVEPTESPTPTPAPSFDDVRESDWFYDAVQYVAKEGLFSGVSERIFDAEGTMTRAMMVTVLYRLAGEPEVAVGTSFEDVAEGAWYSKAVSWAAQNEIVSGITDTRFDPDQSVSREQMAVLLWRYAKHAGIDVSVGDGADLSAFSDAASISEYAVDAFRWACRAGLITGRNGGLLFPKDHITRCEVATILMRFDQMAT